MKYKIFHTIIFFRGYKRERPFTGGANGLVKGGVYKSRFNEPETYIKLIL